MPFQCWSTVFDAGPTLKQHWVNASCFLGSIIMWLSTQWSTIGYSLFSKATRKPGSTWSTTCRGTTRDHARRASPRSTLCLKLQGAWKRRRRRLRSPKALTLCSPRRTLTKTRRSCWMNLTLPPSCPCEEEACWQSWIALTSPPRLN